MSPKRAIAAATQGGFVPWLFLAAVTLACSGPGGESGGSDPGNGSPSGGNGSSGGAGAGTGSSGGSGSGAFGSSSGGSSSGGADPGMPADTDSGPCACVPPLPPTLAAGEGMACVTTVDCAGGLVCGYKPADGCNAQAVCVMQESGPAGPPACGCDGTTVQYVAPGYTGVPVASASPCGTDAGVDGG